MTRTNYELFVFVKWIRGFEDKRNIANVISGDNASEINIDAHFVLYSCKHARLRQTGRLSLTSCNTVCIKQKYSNGRTTKYNTR